jgi:hypothetical protein
MSNACKQTQSIALVVLVVLSLGEILTLMSPECRAQSIRPQSAGPTPGPGPHCGSPENLYAAARNPELTYANLTYGISFRYPSDFYFQKLLAFGKSANPNRSGYGDPDETLLAVITIPEVFSRGTNASSPQLLVGINPQLPIESCSRLSRPAENESGPSGSLTIDGTEFTWQQESHKSSGPDAEIYRRYYTGYAHGVCYEFQMEVLTLNVSSPRYRGVGAAVDVSRVFTELEAILSTSTIRVAPPNPEGTPVEHVTKPWQTSLPFPKELGGLGDLADWQIRYPTGGGPLIGLSPTSKICGVGDSDEYQTISFNYDVSPSLDNASANVAVDVLNAKVVNLIEKNGWRLVKAEPGTPLSETEGCYVKDSVFITVGRGTGRCTMNSPCSVSDISSIDFFIRATNPR